MEFILPLIAGTLYGLMIGIIPAAGPTTGLVAVFSFISYFYGDPYGGVVFCMAVVAAASTGDTFTGVLLGIPGANSSAATMIDGFPLAKQGKATYAITAAVTTSTINGLIWGVLTFTLLPWYSKLLMVLGIPELWAFTVLAMATVGFISSKWWIRSLLAVAFGIFIGMIGMDPYTASDRFTFGWGYLADSVQIMPLLAGVFAIPEIFAGLNKKVTSIKTVDNSEQTWEGIKVVWKYKWDALRGGFIGAIVGLLPGLGGPMSDWMAYGATVAANPNEKFGVGNIRGVIGPEGSNNAQKATAMIPTVLFAIPGSTFAAVLIALFMYLDFELGTPDLAEDGKFFASMTFGFLGATVLVCILSLMFTKYIAMITHVPYKYYFPVLLLFIVWACVQYTGGWEDYVMLVVCSVLGLLCKKFKFSRPALVIGFILAERIEALSFQMVSLYSYESLIERPIFLILIVMICTIGLFGILNKNRLEYV